MQTRPSIQSLLPGFFFWKTKLRNTLKLNPSASTLMLLLLTALCLCGIFSPKMPHCAGGIFIQISLSGRCVQSFLGSWITLHFCQASPFLTNPYADRDYLVSKAGTHPTRQYLHTWSLAPKDKSCFSNTNTQQGKPSSPCTV